MQTVKFLYNIPENFLSDCLSESDVIISEYNSDISRKKISEILSEGKDVAVSIQTKIPISDVIFFSKLLPLLKTVLFCENKTEFEREYLKGFDSVVNVSEIKFSDYAVSKDIYKVDQADFGYTIIFG